MEAGYSVIQNKYIKAENCNYNSTKDLQIRCPFCLDPVFLKKGLHNTTHFSHYPISLTAKECELRSHSYNFFSTINGESIAKGQELKKHYIVFSNCYSLFIGLPANIDVTENDSDIGGISTSLLNYMQSHVDLVDSSVIPKIYFPYFIKNSINCFIYKIDIEGLISKKTTAEIEEEFLRTLTVFFEYFENKNFDFMVLGIEYRKKSDFYSKEPDKAEEIIEEKRKQFKYILNIKFNDNETRFIEKILSLSEKNPAICLDPRELRFISNTLFESDGLKTISLKKIYFFMGQNNIFFFQKKDEGPIWIGLVGNRIDDFLDRISVINAFSEKNMTDNVFYKLFPIKTKKLFLINGSYSDAKKKYLEIIEKCSNQER